MGIAADFVLVILAGFVGGLIARALRLPLLIGYIIAGIFVGPNTPGPTVVQVRDLELLAEIGVAMLLFSLGLEISLRDLGPVRRVSLIGGPIQILLSGLLGAGCVVWLTGVGAVEAAWCGCIIALSSTMVVLKMLSESGHLTTLASRVMVGLLVVQDLAVVPMLIILPQAGRLDGAFGEVAKAIGIAGGFLALMIWLGTRFLPRILERVLTWGGKELFLVAVVAAGVGVGSASHAVGLSFALGAFVAGLVLSESDLSHQALSDVVPLRDVFGLLFFVTVGMIFDPSYAWKHLREVAVLSAAIVLGKAILTGAIARGFGYGNMAPWIVGCGLAQIGEFGFVLSSSAMKAGAMSAETYNLILSCTIVTMLASPFTMRIALPLGRMWKGRSSQLENMTLERAPLTGHVVIAGRGRTGNVVARVAREARIPYVVIELDKERLRESPDDSAHVVWGDVTRPEILEAAGIGEARILVLTIPDRQIVAHAAQLARRLNPNLVVVARAVQRDQVAALKAGGVDVAIQPEFEGGIAMVEQVLSGSGLEPAAAEELIRDLRREMYAT